MTISISARRKARKRAKAEARLNPPAVVEEAAGILSLFRPTPFSGEADIVNTVRRNRILQGMPFNQADESARELALAALKKIGWSVRPRELDGQPFLTSDPRRCHNCGEEYVSIFGPGSDRINGHRTHFCSFDCMRDAAAARRQRPDVKAVKKAWTERKSAEMPEKVCANCQGLFRPPYDNPDQIYCDRECFSSAKKNADKPCLNCGEIFSPPGGKKGETRQFCSKRCAGLYRFRCEAA